MTMYKSSKGDVEISTMVLSHAKNALNKLRRTDPGRADEIEALAAHVEKLEAEAIAENLNPRAVVGGNNPPPDEPEPKLKGREAIDAHVADLLAEVQGCCLVIENQEQADVVARLHRDLQRAVKLVDGAAADEKQPHNDAISEIAAWQNGYTAAKLKRTPDGSLTKALLATTNLSSAWLRKQDDDRRAREAAAAEAARIAAQEAIAAREEAKTSTDLDVIDHADDALAQAEALIREAKGVAKERVRSGGGDGFRAMSLRSVWHAEATGEENCWNMALKHYGAIPEFRDELQALIQKWADRDALNEAARARGVPGFKFTEERKAA